jgi:hypothetical protein
MPGIKNWSRDDNGFAAQVCAALIKACATLTTCNVQFVIANEGRVRQSAFDFFGAAVMGSGVYDLRYGE